MAISLFYALGTGVGGLIGPALFGILVSIPAKRGEGGRQEGGEKEKKKAKSERIESTDALRNSIAHPIKVALTVKVTRNALVFLQK